MLDGTALDKLFDEAVELLRRQGPLEAPPEFRLNIGNRICSVQQPPKKMFPLTELEHVGGGGFDEVGGFRCLWVSLRGAENPNSAIGDGRFRAAGSGRTAPFGGIPSRVHINRHCHLLKCIFANITLAGFLNDRREPLNNGSNRHSDGWRRRHAIRGLRTPQPLLIICLPTFKDAGSIKSTGQSHQSCLQPDNGVKVKRYCLW